MKMMRNGFHTTKSREFEDQLKITIFINCICLNWCLERLKFCISLQFYVLINIAISPFLFMKWYIITMINRYFVISNTKYISFLFNTLLFKNFRFTNSQAQSGTHVSIMILINVGISVLYELCTLKSFKINSRQI